MNSMMQNWVTIENINAHIQELQCNEGLRMERAFGKPLKANSSALLLLNLAYFRLGCKG